MYICHDKYFDPVNFNLKLQYLAEASFSLLLILLDIPSLSYLRISRACLDSGPDQAKCPHGRGHLRPGQAHQGQVVRIYLSEAAVQTGE